MMHTPNLFLTALLAIGLPLCVDAQDTKVAKKKAAPNPAFDKVVDDPALPRVLLIGDSISIGYTVDVQQMLKGKANVHRIPTNAGPTTNGIKNIDAWLGEGKWDVIHFNWGLHDLKFVKSGSTDLAPPNVDGSHHQVDLADYEKNLRTLVERMHKTGAKLIWCSTTPVPEGSAGRIENDELAYNEVAAKIMAEHHVPTDDLHAHAKAKLADVQLPKNVHFTPAGSKYLAEAVARSIEAALPKP